MSASHGLLVNKNFGKTIYEIFSNSKLPKEKIYIKKNINYFWWAPISDIYNLFDMRKLLNILKKLVLDRIIIEPLNIKDPIPFFVSFLHIIYSIIIKLKKKIIQEK